MSRFNNLLVGQFACFLIAVLLAVITIKEYGFAASGVASLGLAAILAAIGWLGPQIVHELAEINDQLSGRSKELHAFLRGLKGISQ